MVFINFLTYIFFYQKTPFYDRKPTKIRVFFPSVPEGMFIPAEAVVVERLSLDVDYEYERGRKVAGPLSPLMHQDSAQL